MPFPLPATSSAARLSPLPMPVRSASLKRLLKDAGFEVHRVTFGEPGTSDIDNLYARIGTERRTSPLPGIPTWCRPATKPHGRSARSPAR